jgi:hypothetical protein
VSLLPRPNALRVAPFNEAVGRLGKPHRKAQYRLWRAAVRRPRTSLRTGIAAAILLTPDEGLEVSQILEYIALVEVDS